MGSVGDDDAPGMIGGGICMDCDDDRRKKGMDEGVKRFDWPRRMDDEGLSGPALEAVSAEVVWLVLALEPVSVRLGMAPRSGVLDVDGKAGVRTEPTEDKEAREVADVIASG